MKQDPYIPAEDAEKFFTKGSPTYFELKRRQLQREYWFADDKEVESLNKLE